MNSANHGEGAGFCIFGTVVDSSILIDPFVKYFTGFVVFAQGVAIKYAWDLTILSEETQCCSTLGQEHVQALDAVYNLMASNCTYYVELGPAGAKLLSLP